MYLDEIVQEQLDKYNVSDDGDLKFRCVQEISSKLFHCDFDRNPKKFFTTLAGNYIRIDIKRKQFELKNNQTRLNKELK
jgi:hypothetical protein